MNVDVIVVGGGPSGIFSAIAAEKNGLKVVIIEKNKQLGRKMMISGGGRCNLTNNTSVEGLIENVPGNGRFLNSAFRSFSNDQVTHFFEQELGVKLKIENGGKVFPVSDRSSTIVKALEEYVLNKGIEVLYNSAVHRLLIKDQSIHGVILQNGQVIHSQVVILATGGLSFPKTGSTGDGFKLAKDVGHTIKQTFPSSVPLLSDDIFIKEKMLQGVSLRDVEVKLHNENNKLIRKETGDLIFTHYGLSGPAVLRISRFVSLFFRENTNQNLKITIDIFPQRKREELMQQIKDLKDEYSKKTIFNAFKGFLPDKLLNVIIHRSGLEDMKMLHLKNKNIEQLVSCFKGFSIIITGTRPLKEAFVTGGGVNLKEIDPKSFSSKLVKGLFLVGELLDIDAFTGGFNMQTAFSSGYVAGSSAKRYIITE